MRILKERAAFVPGNVGFDAPDRKVHHCKAPGRVVGLLAVDRDVADFSAVGEHEPLRLYEHPARTAARVKHPPLVRLDHLDKEPDHRARRVKLAAGLAFGIGEPPKEVFVNAADDVVFSRLGVAETDPVHEIHDCTETRRAERRLRILFRQHAA